MVLSLLCVFVLLELAQTQLPPSQQEYFHKDNEDHTTAKLRDILLHEAQLHYIFEGIWPPGVPAVRQHFAWQGKAGPFLGVREVSLTDLPTLLGDRAVGEIEEKVVVAWRAPGASRYSVGELLYLVYQHACSYLNLCTHAALSEHLTVLLHGKQAAASSSDYSSLLACLSKKVIDIHANETQSMTVVLKEAIAGIGPHDRAYAADLRHYDRFTAPPRQLSQGFRDVLITCTGSAPYKHERRKPYRVSLVNRTPLRGRHVLNMHVMLQHMDALSDLQASVVNLEGMNLSQQAEVYTLSDIVIGTYAAASEFIPFMADGAVYINYGFNLNDTRRHNAPLQIIDDLSMMLSFIGISASSRHAVLPKMEAEWSVLQPAMEAAFQILDSQHSQHRYLILDVHNGFNASLHRHVDDFASPSIETQDTLASAV